VAQQVQLGPGIELAVTGSPFGETPAWEVDGMGKRQTRRVRIWSIVMAVLAILWCVALWHIGQPLWGGWPQVQATVASAEDWNNRYQHCDLGLDYAIAGQAQHRHHSTLSTCAEAPAVGSVVTLAYSPGDHGWMTLPGTDSGPLTEVIMLGLVMGIPVFWSTLIAGFVWRSYRRKRALACWPWREVSAKVKKRISTKAGQGFVMESPDPGGADWFLAFGLAGISLFTVPRAGETFRFMVAGGGTGPVLVGIPGHFGESLGVAGKAGATAPQPSGPLVPEGNP